MFQGDLPHCCRAHLQPEIVLLKGFHHFDKISHWIEYTNTSMICFWRKISYVFYFCYCDNKAYVIFGFFHKLYTYLTVEWIWTKG